MGYIYKITNQINNKCYIGQTRNNIKYRWQHHKWKANNPNKPDTDYPLYHSMRKYGIQNFTIIILEEVDNEQLNQKEQFWINELNSLVPNGYNCNLGGDGSFKFNYSEILNYYLNQGNENASKTAKKFNCSLNTILKILAEQNLKGQGKYIKIYQIDKNTGEIIKQFPSLIAAEQELNITHTQLWAAVNHQAKTAGGYCWCKVNDFKNFKLSQYKDKRKRQVQCIETQQIFNSVKDAARWCIQQRLTDGNINNVYNNLLKVIKKTGYAYNLHWINI